jgi:hypothetical protein
VSTDPFGTEELRRAVLQAWRSSPTRFREDANAEEDLLLGGYRDRWFVELAQNAADAAACAGVPGELRVYVRDGELRVANTGEPLDAAGVAALASLRASAKRGGRSVGRFGIGFAAVLPVSTEPSVVSRHGGVAFSAEQTRRLIADEPRLREEMESRGGRVPVLRLVWPTEPTKPGDGPPEGFDTEVRLPLGPDADAAALLAEAAGQAADLLLALPALRCIDLAGRVYRRHDLGEGLVVLDDPDGSMRWQLVRRDGELPADLLAAAEERLRPHWSVCWAVPVSPAASPRPIGSDVLHAPTPTDERLSLPARLLVTMPMEPSRRRIRPGAATDHVLAEAVRAYPELVTATPPEHRTVLVPHAGFPRSDVDAVLRDGVVAALRAVAWLPAADGTVVSPAGACVLDIPVPRLVELLADLIPGLLAESLSGPLSGPPFEAARLQTVRAQAMAVLGVPRLGLADVVAAVSGVDRPPRWWYELYDALSLPVDADPAARDELAALPVPLADGRTVTGPRTTTVLDRPLALPGLRVVHPDAAHPLLVRLGAQQSGPRALLDSTALREAVERSVEDAEAGLDTAPLADTVLALVVEAGGTAATQVPAQWLGALALPDETGEPRRADELVLPDGALRAVLAPDTPIGVLHPDVAGRHPRAALRAVGVLDGFAVVVDENPTAPDHDLADEDRWWRGLAEPPQQLVAVRDLDLVDDGAWLRALRLLAAEPDTRRVLHDPGTGIHGASQDGYTRWWLARHALLAGRPPRHWGLASATALAGLYDPVPADLDLDEDLLAAAGVRAALGVTGVEDAADVLARLADPGRRPSPATVRAAHAALAAAVAEHALDVDDLEPPAAVRAMSGATVDAGSAYVLDRPWLAGIADPDRAVAGGDPVVLAELLDLPLASDELAGEVVSTGREVPWAELPEVAAVCEALAREVPRGAVTLHERLRVRTPDGVEHTVPFWVDGDTVHAADPVHAILWTG